MRVGKVDMNPARNPAVLDTATWDVESASRMVMTVDDAGWRAMRDGAIAGGAIPSSGPITPHAASAARHGACVYFLAGLAGSQQAFIAIGTSGGTGLLGAPVTSRPLDDGYVLVYATDAATVDRYTQVIRPDRAPEALGGTPRLGIGARMTTAMWPAVYEAMDRARFAANPIQNSARELALLEDILTARAPDALYYPGFGTVDAGHTGSTFEGLWTYGVLEALKSNGDLGYGADADHIPVARGPGGLARARQVLDAARFYTFFTLDAAAAIDHRVPAAGSGVQNGPPPAQALSRSELNGVSAYHRQFPRIGNRDYVPDKAMLGRLVGKYWDALDATQALVEHLRELKGPRPFDLELAIDEGAPGLSAWDCITTDDEVTFLLVELKRRGIPVTHLAPHLGIEKSTDYRCPDGLVGLAARVRSQHQIAQEFGVLLDFHSGDDLSQATRRVIGRATRGRNHFKISPMPQTIFAETVRDVYPDLFRRWWQEARSYAEREAALGSGLAARCIADFHTARTSPSPRDTIFYNFGFAFVGKRDRNGQYLNRESLYGLERDFYREYQSRIIRYLCSLAEDLFNE